MMNIREYLKNKKLLFDGAMGTYYASITKNDASSCERAVLTDIDTVRQIHESYIESGAVAIKTDTFAAVNMDKDEQKLIIPKACEIANTAAKGKAFVFASLAPVENTYDAYEIYISAIDLFLDNGVTNFLFETLYDNRGVCEAAKYIKEKSPESFVISSYAVQPSGFTRAGNYYISLIREAEESGQIDSVGLNCVCGPAHLQKLAEKIQTKLFVSVMPNAGYPTVVGNRTVFGKDENYFAMRMCDIARSGADIIGGCCGTTPHFIRSCADNNISEIKADFHGTQQSETKTVAKKSNHFYEKLMRGERVIAVELDPPEDLDTGFFLSGALKLKNAGCDAITIADCPVARPRMDSSILACKLKREFDIEPLPHMTCRDRNLNAIKALLLGLSAEGVNNVLVVTGDPVPGEQRDEVKSVFNFNSRMLIKFISSLNEINLSNPINICAALNINAVNFDVQLRLAEQKVENGASVFLTQPLMTKRGLENLKRAKETLNAKILCGIMPVVSYRNAMYMNSEIAGIDVDERIVELFKDKSKEESEEIGKTVALKAAKAAYDYCDGYYLITPFKRVNLMCEIISSITEKSNLFLT